MKSNIKKDISIVFIVNIVNMIFSVAGNFILPKFLSIDTYATIKTYQFYMGYIGVFHLGYVDGIYLKYGGRNLQEANNDEVAEDLSVFRIAQILLVAVMIIFSIYLEDFIFLIFVLSIFPYNALMYLKTLYQATGEFSKYGNIMNISTLMIFVLNMLLVFVVKTDKYIYYLLVYLISYIGIWLFFEIRTKYWKRKIFFFSISVLKEHVQSGWLLMLGNLTSVMLTGIDRWFVKLCMNNIAFAMYSFAVTLENMLNLLIMPVTVTLYNYFCKDENYSTVVKTKNYAMIFASAIVAVAFPIKFIVQHFLCDYRQSLVVVYLLFATQIFHVIIKAIYVNLYKVQKKQNKYFSRVIFVIVIGIVLNILFYLLVKRMEVFAVATLLTSIIWYFVSKYDFANIKCTVGENLYPFIVLLIFLICVFNFGAIIGMLVYISTIVLATFLCMRNIIDDVIGEVKKRLSRKR